MIEWSACQMQQRKTQQKINKGKRRVANQQDRSTNTWGREDLMTELEKMKISQTCMDTVMGGCHEDLIYQLVKIRWMDITEIDYWDSWLAIWSSTYRLVRNHAEVSGQIGQIDSRRGKGDKGGKPGGPEMALSDFRGWAQLQQLQPIPYRNQRPGLVFFTYKKRTGKWMKMAHWNSWFTVL